MNNSELVENLEEKLDINNRTKSKSKRTKNESEGAIINNNIKTKKSKEDLDFD